MDESYKYIIGWKKQPQKEKNCVIHLHEFQNQTKVLRD